MHRYPPNSPLAAARAVALTLMADDSVSRGELASLERLGVYSRLKLDPLEMQVLLEHLARDLFEFGAAWDGPAGLHPMVIDCVLDDVSDPELRAQVLDLCRAVAQADSHLTGHESAVLAQATRRWGLPACNLPSLDVT